MTVPHIPTYAAADRPVLSVMVPLYRPDPELLRETIASLRAAAQGIASMQIALVQDEYAEDGQGLGDLLRACQAEGIEVHPSVGRLGIAGNWNRCVSLARGEYVHILHQDDRVRPGFYDAVLAGFRADPRVGASFTQQAFISRSGDVLYEGHMRRDAAGILDDWFEHVVANPAIQCPAIVVRRSAYEAVGGFDPSYRYCLDRDMWQRIAAAFPIWYDPRPLAEFRKHEGSESARLSASLRPWREMKRCLAAGLELLPATARRQTAKSGRCHSLRLAFWAARDALSKRRWQAAAVAWMGGVLIGRPSDYLTLRRREHPTAPLARAQENGRKRAVILSEFFPGGGERSVTGAFARLRRIMEGLSEIGELDAVFYWPQGAAPSAEQMLEWEGRIRADWPVAGRVRFVVPGRALGLLDRITDMAWMLRGAVSFMNPRPSLRTSARAPVRALRAILAELQPDLVFAHRIGAAVALWRAGTPMPPMVVDIDDLEDVKLLRLARTMPRWTDRLRLRGWARVARMTMRQIADRASRVFVSSEHDAERLQRLCPGAAVDVVPNSSPAFDGVGTPLETAPVAVFVGTFDYAPNREGIEWLVAKVWPAIRRAVPSATLLVVGFGADTITALSGVEGVEVLGFVKDLGPVYRRARFAVCPVARGAGTRIKIIEAAMNGRCSVSRVVGAEGLAFVPPDEIILADDPGEFAAACVRLFEDAGLAEDLGGAAMSKASALYSPALAAARIAASCRAALLDGEANAVPVGMGGSG